MSALGACGADNGPPYPSDEDRSTYPDGPYGLSAGDTIADYPFGTPGGPIHLQDLRENELHRLLVLFVTRASPDTGAEEAEYLGEHYSEYRDRGIEVLGVLVEAYDHQPTADEAATYFGIHDAPYPSGADDWGRLGDDLGEARERESPLNFVIDLDTMRITARLVGWSADELENHLYYSP